MAMMGMVAAGMTVLGTVMQMEAHKQAGASARLAGKRANVAAQFEAQQLEQQSGQSIAASQRDAVEERRRADLVASRALAVAAASGAGASDPTVVKIIADIKGEGAYRSAVAMYQGEDQARKLDMGAKARRYEGAVSEEAGVNTQYGHRIASNAALFKGASSLATRYGGGASYA